MRAAPPLAFTVSRFGVWRAALALLAAFGAVTMTLWEVGADRPVTPWLALAGVAGALLAALPLAQSFGLRACSLRWDGQRWHLTAAENGGASAGRLAVAIDLGGWMLLRFAADGAEPRRPAWRCTGWTGAVWIPLQRRGLESQWHGIRSTLHSARPLPDAAADTPAR